MGKTKLDETEIFKSALNRDSFDVTVGIKIPFFRVLVSIEPGRSLLQFVTTNCLKQNKSVVLVIISLSKLTDGRCNSSCYKICTITSHFQSIPHIFDIVFHSNYVCRKLLLYYKNVVSSVSDFEIASYMG